MNILFLLMCLTTAQYCSNHILNAENSHERISQKKVMRNVETYTTILLDDEAFSIVSDTKRLENQSNEIRDRKKASTKNMEGVGGNNGLLTSNKVKKAHMIKTNNTSNNKRHKNISTGSQDRHGKPRKSSQLHDVEQATVNNINTDFIKKNSEYQGKSKHPRNKNSSLSTDKKNNILETDESEEETEHPKLKPSLTISILKNADATHEGKNISNKEKERNIGHKSLHKANKSKRHFVQKSLYNRRNREIKKELGRKLRYYPTYMIPSNLNRNGLNNTVDKRTNFARQNSAISSNNLPHDSNADISGSISLTTQNSITRAYISDSIDRTSGNKPSENDLFTMKIFPFKQFNTNSHYKTNEVVTNSNRDFLRKMEQHHEPSVITRSFESIEQSSTPSKFNYWNAPTENLPNDFEDSINNSTANAESNYYRNGKSLPTSTILWRAQTDPPVYSMTFRQADIVQRNLQKFSLEDSNHGKPDNLSGDESDLDDTAITFDIACDETDNRTCWVQREVGDVLTLAVKIESSKKPSSFQIRWMKSYHVFESKREKTLEIEQGKLPWNMVSGSEGRELRLNPVTNTDIDPNCFIAIVFYLNKVRGKTLFTEVKKLIFHIDISIIDMGKVYAGEELSINIENFLSLPERGNLIFEWNLETKPHEYEALPSNAKVSNSGRSVVLKELKKGRLGVLNCVIYSPSKYAIAKRRFNILKIADSKKRRSVFINSEGKEVVGDSSKSRRCRHIIRRSQEKALRKFQEGTKPKTRKKRFKRMELRSRYYSNIDCEPLRKKVYSRWLRWAIAGLGETTTEDPRLMSMEKLYVLSEEGDGTLDDVIPRETHYVEPEVKLVSGTSVESETDHPYASNCTDDSDCDENAYCYNLDEGNENTSGSEGYCICHREYYRYGKKCIEIPLSNQRRKRLKRESQNDFAVPHHLFYDHRRESLAITPKTLEEETDMAPPKILAFEEEESFLLSDCIDDKDCSMHANCVQPSNGHPYCKCRPGHRGNGIFCWEIIDYVPPEENFPTDESDMNVREPLAMPVLPKNYLAFRTPEAEELEEQ